MSVEGDKGDYSSGLVICNQLPTTRQCFVIANVFVIYDRGGYRNQ